MLCYLSARLLFSDFSSLETSPFCIPHLLAERISLTVLSSSNFSSTFRGKILFLFFAKRWTLFIFNFGDCFDVKV